MLAALWDSALAQKPVRSGRRARRRTSTEARPAADRPGVSPWPAYPRSAGGAAGHRRLDPHRALEDPPRGVAAARAHDTSCRPRCIDVLSPSHPFGHPHRVRPALAHADHPWRERCTPWTAPEASESPRGLLRGRSIQGGSGHPRLPGGRGGWCSGRALGTDQRFSGGPRCPNWSPPSRPRPSFAPCSRAAPLPAGCRDRCHGRPERRDRHSETCRESRPGPSRTIRRDRHRVRSRRMRLHGRAPRPDAVAVGSRGRLLHRHMKCASLVATGRGVSH